VVTDFPYEGERKVISRSADEVTVMAEGLQFPEGPVSLPDGSVLVVEIRRQTLSRVSPSGEVEVIAHCGGGPNGAAFWPDGRVWICNNGGFEWKHRNGTFLPGRTPADYEGGSIQAVDISTGEVETVYTSCGKDRLLGPNDLVFDDAGGFWFTDPGKVRARDRDLGSLLYARADGSEIRMMAAELDTPNGVGLSPEGDVLYVSMTMPARVYRWTLESPGTFTSDPSNRRGQFYFGHGGNAAFDSLAVDGDGHVCVGTIASKGGITDVVPGGGGSELVATGDSWTTNICFGGKDLRMAYMTCSGTGTLRVTRWPRPGLALCHNPY
jgi:gluconolactonase